MCVCTCAHMWTQTQTRIHTPVCQCSLSNKVRRHIAWERGRGVEESQYTFLKSINTPVLRQCFIICFSLRIIRQHWFSEPTVFIELEYTAHQREDTHCLMKNVFPFLLIHFLMHHSTAYWKLENNKKNETRFIFDVLILLKSCGLEVKTPSK